MMFYAFLCYCTCSYMYYYTCPLLCLGFNMDLDSLAWEIVKSIPCYMNQTILG